MKPKIQYPKLQPQLDPEIQQLAERVGDFIEYWGFKAVQGRMWCYLFLSAQPLSSIELAQLLKISPALVTQSVQVLIEYRVILPAEKGPNGVLRYQANPNAAEAISGVLKARESKMLEQISVAARKALKASTRPSRSGYRADAKRVAEVGSWVSVAQQLLGSGLEILSQSDNPFAEPRGFAEKWELE